MVIKRINISNLFTTKSMTLQSFIILKDKFPIRRLDIPKDKRKKEKKKERLRPKNPHNLTCLSQLNFKYPKSQWLAMGLWYGFPSLIIIFHLQSKMFLNFSSFIFSWCTFSWFQSKQTIVYINSYSLFIFYYDRWKKVEFKFTSWIENYSFSILYNFKISVL